MTRRREKRTACKQSDVGSWLNLQKRMRISIAEYYYDLIASDVCGARIVKLSRFRRSIDRWSHSSNFWLVNQKHEFVRNTWGIIVF